MVRRIFLALSRLGTRQSLGQHRLWRRRQGLQAQDRNYRVHNQERHRFDVQDSRYEEFLDDQVQERSDRHQVFSNQILFSKRKRCKVIGIFSDQGCQDPCNRIDCKVQCIKVGFDLRKVILCRNGIRNHKVNRNFLRTFFRRFHHLQQAFNFQQHQVRKLFFRQQRKLQVLQLRFIRQQLPQLFLRKLFFR